MQSEGTDSADPDDSVSMYSFEDDNDEDGAEVEDDDDESEIEGFLDEEGGEWDEPDAFFGDFIPMEGFDPEQYQSLAVAEPSGAAEMEHEEEEGNDELDAQLAALSRPSSAMPNGGEEEEETGTMAILDSLQNVLPELQSPPPPSTAAGPSGGAPATLRMTDLGMQISRLILRRGGERAPASVRERGQAQRSIDGSDDGVEGERGVFAPSTEEEEAPATAMEEKSDAYLERALSGRRRNRTGVRGRPKRVDYGFGKSTTHTLPPEVSRIMGQANMCYVQRKYSDATALLLEVVRQAPHAFEAYQTLGMIHEEQDDLAKAMSYYVIAAHLIKNDVDLWRKLAKLTLQLGRHNEALYYLSKLIRMRDPLPEYFWIRARLHVERLEYRRAIMSFNRLLFLSVEGDGRVFEQVATLAERLHHEDLIVDTFYQVLMQAIGAPLHRTPSLAVLLVVLRCLLATKEDDDKLVALVEAAAVPLVSDQSHAALPSAWYAVEDAQRLELALTLLPVELRLLYAIAKVRLKAASAALYSFAPELDPHQHGDLMRELGRSLLAIAQAEAALSVLLPLMEVPALGDAGLGAMIGECYRLIPGLEEMAISTFEAVLEVAPERTDVRTALCDLYRQQGQPERAAEVLCVGDASVWRAAGAGGATGPGGISSSRTPPEGMMEGGVANVQRVFEGLFVWDETVLGPLDQVMAAAGEQHPEASTVMPVINVPTSAAAPPPRTQRRRRPGRRRKLSAYSEAQMRAIRRSFEQVRASLTPGAVSPGDPALMRQTRQLALPLLDDMMRNRAILPDGNISKVVRTEKRSLLHGLGLAEWLELLQDYLIAEAGCGSPERAFKMARLFAVRSVFIYDLSACLRLRLLMLGLALRIGNVKFLAVTVKLIFKAVPGSGLSLALLMRALAICGGGGEMQDGALHRFLARHALKPTSPRGAQLAYLGVSLFTERFEAAVMGGSALLARQPQDPMGLLATAVALLHQSLKRTCRNVEGLQRQALALLYSLCEVDQASGAYNLARAYHMLGMLGAATHYYRRALRSGSFREEAAFNLYLLFMHIGNARLAAHYLATIPAV